LCDGFGVDGSQTFDELVDVLLKAELPKSWEWLFDDLKKKGKAYRSLLLNYKVVKPNKKSPAQGRGISRFLFEN
jgi:hypothetical protein